MDEQPRWMFHSRAMLDRARVDAPEAGMNNKEPT